MTHYRPPLHTLKGKQMSDYPNLRNSPHCPLCSNEKDSGLVVCWPCHRREKWHNGCYSERANQIIEAREQVLTLVQS